MNIYDYLDSLEIKYDKVEHKAVYTCEEAEFVKNIIDGTGCKNLFLKDSRKKYFLYILPDDKRADLKELEINAQTGRLSFASEQRLDEVLKLKKGSVTPLGIANDNDKLCTVLIDSQLVNKKLLVHPLVNTATLSIMYDDLLKFITATEHNYRIVY